MHVWSCKVAKSTSPSKDSAVFFEHLKLNCHFSFIQFDSPAIVTCGMQLLLHSLEQRFEERFNRWHVADMDDSDPYWINQQHSFFRDVLNGLVSSA